MSGFGCHIKGVYGCSIINYADDITIVCSSIGGLNEMLKICYSFAQSNSIIVAENECHGCVMDSFIGNTQIDTGSTCR